MWELTPETLSAGAVGVLIVVTAVANYLQKRKGGPPDSQALHALGILPFHDQTERVATALEEIVRVSHKMLAIAERMSDARQADIQNTLHRLEKSLKGEKP